MYEEVLAAHRRTLGDEHPDTLTSINNLGVLRRAKGDLARGAGVLAQDPDPSQAEPRSPGTREPADNEFYEKPLGGGAIKGHIA